MKKIGVLLLSILLIGGLWYFWPWEFGGIRLAKPHENMVDLVKTQYEDETLQEIYSIEGASLEELNRLYPVECMRKDGDTFTILYRGQQNNVILYYDNQLARLDSTRHATSSKTSNDLASLPTNGYTSLERFRDFDAAAEIFGDVYYKDFLYFVDFYTRDGYVVEYQLRWEDAKQMFLILRTSRKMI